MRSSRPPAPLELPVGTMIPKAAPVPADVRPTREAAPPKGDDMTDTVDAAFVRRAVELADLNAVRVALFQHTGDPDLAALPVAANLDAAQRELLVSKAVAWLAENAGPGMPAEPPEAELGLINSAIARISPACPQYYTAIGARR